jgi:Dyp-type peroxidase family
MIDQRGAEPELDEVQRLIVHGYRFGHVHHLLLHIESAAYARAFLASMATQVSTAARRPAQDAVSCAITLPGLRALEAPADCIDAFERLAPAYFEGAALRASRHLGDTGRNESPRWETQFVRDRTHVILSVYAGNNDELDQCVRHLRNTFGATGLSGWDMPLVGRVRRQQGESQYEAFGFRDGISQPTIRGVDKHNESRNPPRMNVAAGEFLLGHANEEGENLWADRDLPALVRKFVTNGCFVALRKMHQDVAAFERSGDALTRAKMCGRWPNGAVVTPGAVTAPKADPDHLNDFTFEKDADGAGCPFGAHIRRMNPRTDPVTIRPPVLVRRGVPYGEEDGADQGLIGLFLCASLERRFEFLLRDWGKVPPMNPHRDTLAGDPMIGSPVTGYRITPGAPPAAIPGLGSFVTTKGTIYGFYPSVSALAMIGSFTDRHGHAAS